MGLEAAKTQCLGKSRRGPRVDLREIMDIVLNVVKRLRALVFAVSIAALGCHAQTPAHAAAEGAGANVSPELARRIEVMIRSRSDVPPQYVISIGDRKKSEVPGYDQVTVSFRADGNTSKPLTFLVSTDGKTLAQFNKFDISADPKDKVSGAGRPGRGGGEDAPVLIVGFDDLECPFCARFHAALFPAILDRYKDQVRVVYLDFPLTDIHPWAMHAAVDANCLAPASVAGYWNFVDYVHAHASEIGGEEHSAAKASATLDKLAQDEGTRQKVNPADLEACIKKQDDTKVKASMKVGDALGLTGTPATFINGEKVDGVTPMENIFRMVDGALTAAGRTPPPPYKAPPAAPTPAMTPGN
jgi:protein-disulfide isomerase